VTVDGTPFYLSMSNLVTYPETPTHERLKRRHAKGRRSYQNRLLRRKGKRLLAAIGSYPKRQVEPLLTTEKETLKLTLKRGIEDMMRGERYVRRRSARLAARFVLQGLANKAISRKMVKRGHREARRNTATDDQVKKQKVLWKILSFFCRFTIVGVKDVPLVHMWRITELITSLSQSRNID